MVIVGRQQRQGLGRCGSLVVAILRILDGRPGIGAIGRIANSQAKPSFNRVFHRLPIGQFRTELLVVVVVVVVAGRGRRRDDQR